MAERERGRLDVDIKGKVFWPMRCLTCIPTHPLAASKSAGMEQHGPQMATLADTRQNTCHKPQQTAKVNSFHALSANEVHLIKS